MRPVYGGIDFGTSNSTVGVIENGRPRLVPLEERACHAAQRRLLQLRGQRHLFRPQRHRPVHRWRRRPADARAEKRARQFAGPREDAPQVALHRLHRHHRHVSRPSEEAAREPCRRTASTRWCWGGRCSSSTTMPTRTPRPRPNSKRRPARKGFRHIAFQFEPIAAALDYEQSVTREELALIVDMGGGTSDFSIVRVSPRAGRGQRPQGRHPCQSRHPYRRHGFRPAAQPRACDARTRLSDADQGRQAQPARRLFRRPGDLAAHQPALHRQGEDRPAPDALRGGAAGPRRPADRGRRPPLRPCAGAAGGAGQDRADRPAGGVGRCRSDRRTLQRGRSPATGWRRRSAAMSSASPRR